MTPGPGYTKNPGRATPFSKEREHIFTHWFVGANVLVPTMLGAHKHADLAREMLEAAATIEIIQAPQTLRPGDKAVIGVRVTNVGAGHKLPTGFPEGREMWVDFSVTDADGKIIYRLGEIKDGQTEPGTNSFKIVLADKDGRPQEIEVWKADRVLYDTRLLPKGFADLTYRFVIPPGTPGPITLRADLKYWSFSQAMVDYLLGNEAPKVPVTHMTAITMNLELAGQQASAAVK